MNEGLGAVLVGVRGQMSSTLQVCSVCAGQTEREWRSCIRRGG